MPPHHDLPQVRANDVSGQAVVFDNFERLLLDAALSEGLKPSVDNLPPPGEFVARHRVDAATGEKSAPVVPAS